MRHKLLALITASLLSLPVLAQESGATMQMQTSHAKTTAVKTVKTKRHLKKHTAKRVVVKKHVTKVHRESSSS